MSKLNLKSSGVTLIVFCCVLVIYSSLVNLQTGVYFRTTLPTMHVSRLG